MKTELIIVEGIPGTGKSLTASFIKELLDKNHIQSILYQEGNLDHPADYESVACLDDAEYDNLLLKYNKDRDLIFLYQDSVKKTFEKVIPERPKEWLDFVIGYVTQQEYGKVHQLEGFEGLVKFYEALRTLEVDIFKTLPFKKLFIDNSGLNWDKCHQDIEIFLKEAL